ncbi:putative oxidoreductase [Streptomyces viridiviolaceus]|uniref:NAD(P)/FAD-dependent oxidoreductase n=1 Tax=Streptomyces viridiviolaceus TaxID=68282 RepID=A0ABW2DRT9_9ACTN|nr:FAD-binding oxidoreductase [Streptomyces viridiviolaceus]GHB32699.1 putative oxidoreductase [Streptomyces viridiviolaceus]
MSNSGITYSAHSGWADTPTDVAPGLDGDTTCDVAVVGGGLAGMAAALRLAERGLDVVLLEAGFCGTGASSRNAGQLTGAPAGDPELLSALHPRRFPPLVRFAERAVHFTEGLLERLDTDCEYEPTGNIGAAVSLGQLRRARRKARILQKGGGEAEFGDARELGLPDSFLGGILEPVGGLLNPGKFTLGLRAELLRSRARVFEDTAVEAVERQGSRVIVRANRGRVRAERVLLATNAYSRSLVGPPARLATPVWVSMVETEPVEPGRLEEIGWTSRAGIATQHNLMQSFRPTPRGTITFGVRRLQLGRGAVVDHEPPRPVVQDLVRGFHERFPSLRDVAPRRAWGGWVALTPSWLPVAGEAESNVFYGIGCNGHGLAQAPYLGTLLADRIAGDELHDDLRAVWRQRSWFAPSPVFNSPALYAVWAVDRLSDRLSRRTGP